MKASHKLLATILSASVALSGCISANYKTADGTPITKDTIAAFKANQGQALSLPYKAGTIEYQQYPWLTEQQQNNSYYLEAKKKSDAALNEVLQSWTDPNGNSSLDMKVVNVKPEVGGALATAIPSAFLMIFSAGIIPTFAGGKLETDVTLSSNNNTLYQHRGSYSGTVFVGLLPWGKLKGQKYIEEVQVYGPLMGYKSNIVAAISAEQPIYDSLKNSNDINQLSNALNNGQLKFFRPLVAQRLASVISKRRDRIAQYQKQIAKDPSFANYIEGNDAIYFVGPQGFTVIEVMQKIKSKSDADIVASLIRSANKPYKQFTADEVLWLNKKGVPSKVVTAMIDVSSVQNISAQNNTAVAMPAGAGAIAPATATAGSKPNGVQAAASECAKAYAAKKACEKMPSDPLGLVLKGCMKQVKKKFGGLGCPIPL